jgi:hypothetical protein
MFETYEIINFKHMRSAIMTNKVGDNTTAGRVAFCHFVSFSSIDNKQGEGGQWSLNP